MKNSTLLILTSVLYACNSDSANKINIKDMAINHFLNCDFASAIHAANNVVGHNREDDSSVIRALMIKARSLEVLEQNKEANAIYQTIIAMAPGNYSNLNHVKDVTKNMIKALEIQTPAKSVVCDKTQS